MPGQNSEWCTLGMPDAVLEYISLTSHVWQTQVHARFKELYGAEKIIQSFYSGAAPSQLMDPLAVIELARKLYDSCDPEDPEAFTKLDNILDAIRATYLEERSKLFGSFAIQNTLKEKGIMTVSTKLTDAVVQKFNDTEGKSKDTQTLIDMIESAEQTGMASIAPKLNVGDFNGDSTKRQKRKKSKSKSNHLPNMSNKSVKRALGASILGLLGKVQRDTQDSQKKALLKELPAADVIEMATGNKLPDYQANLINNLQAKADPDSPIVKRMQLDNQENESTKVKWEEIPDKPVVTSAEEVPVTGSEDLAGNPI